VPPAARWIVPRDVDTTEAADHDPVVRDAAEPA
jgi:hypothetical protein